MTREKRTCSNPNHPFKQDWYWYHDADWNDDFDKVYCSSCAHMMRSMDRVIGVLLEPHETLYGNSQLQLTREQAVGLVNGVYDRLEEDFNDN